MTSKRKATEGAPKNPNTSVPVKRQRVSRACDQCRTAREKCDGTQPRCYPCVSQNRSCTYEFNPRRRGVQPGYIRSLEITLAWIFEEVPGSGEALNVFLTREAGQKMLSGEESADADRLLRRWRKSKMLRDIERVLSGTEPPSPLRDKISPDEDVSDSNGESEQLMPATFSNNFPSFPSASFSGRPTRRLPSPCNDYLSAVGLEGVAPSFSIPTGPVSATRRLKLPSQHWRLLDIYFSYTHCWFPILEKQNIFRALYLYPEQGLLISRSDPSCGVHAELWSALALASFQDSASSKSSTPAITEQSGGVLPHQIYEIARGLIPSDNGPFEIQHVRALLLLALINLGRDNVTSTWMLVGFAIRILRGHDDSQGPGNVRHQPRWQSTTLACFILDTMIAVRCNKLPQLTTENIAGIPPLSDNEVEEWEPWKSCEGFGAEAGLTHLARNPAYCMTTFNQLCRIFMFINSARQNVVRAQDHSSIFQLQKSIEPGSRFNDFIISPNLGSVAVPSPYIARVAFLWACTFLDDDVEAQKKSLTDTIEQYTAHFGACGTPPFFAVCLFPPADARNTFSFRENDSERLTSLRALLLSTWNNSAQSSQSQNEGRFDIATQCAVTAQDRVQRRANATAQRPSVALSTPVEPFYGPPTTTNQPFFARQQQTAEQPSFADVPVNYDTLLDDLELAGCIDNPAINDQFITNLGFGPGHDVTELLSREFGAI